MVESYDAAPVVNEVSGISYADDFFLDRALFKPVLRGIWIR